jgi:integrase
MVYDLTDKTLKLKTRSSYRIIPVHSNVNIALLKDLPSKDNLSKKINNLIRTHISEDKRKVLYSLRHSFATDLKNNKVEPTIISELMGHSHHSMTLDRYAGRYTMDILKEAIQTLKY